MDKISNYWSNMPVPDTIRVDPTEYSWYGETMKKDGVDIAPIESYIREKLDITELRMLQQWFKMQFLWKHRFLINLELAPGFTSDLASSPGPLRGIVDNDSLIVLVAAYGFHDPAFGLHLLPFKEANEIFHDLIEFFIHRIYNFKKDFYRKLMARDLKYAKKQLKNLDKWKRRALRRAKLYRWGVSTRIGKRIYDSVDYENHWNKPFVQFNCTEL